MILQNINQVQNTLMKDISLKEQIFFNKLFDTGENKRIKFEDLKSSIEKVCYFAFVDKRKKEEMQTYLGDVARSDIKGMSYKNNLIELLAMYLLQPEVESDLKVFYDVASIDERVVIEAFVPAISKKSSLSEEKITPIELSIQLEKCTDLIKLYEIRKRALALFDIDVNREKDRYLLTLLIVFKRYITCLRILFLIGFFALCYFVGRPFAEYFLDNWDKLEKYITLVTLAGGFVVSSIIIILGININKSKIFEMLLIFLLVWNIKQTKEIYDMKQKFKEFKQL